MITYLMACIFLLEERHLVVPSSRICKFQKLLLLVNKNGTTKETLSVADRYSIRMKIVIYIKSLIIN
jgi:hypothetical protein